MFEGDFNLVGKHATYTKFLVSEAGIFNRYIDVYMNGAIFGFLYGRKGVKDSESNDRARIYADAFATERLRCDFIYRLIMLLDETSDLTIEKRLDRAFRDDANAEAKEKNANNNKLFNSYVLGGIEVLYEKFTEDCTTQEDYFNKIYDVVSNFNDELEGDYEEKFEELMRISG